MFEREIRLYRFMLGYLKSIANDLDDSQITLPITVASNPPAVPARGAQRLEWEHGPAS